MQKQQEWFEHSGCVFTRAKRRRCVITFTRNAQHTILGIQQTCLRAMRHEFPELHHKLLELVGQIFYVATTYPPSKGKFTAQAL